MSSARESAMLGVGQVRHTRLRPHTNRFSYPTYFLMLPMRSLRARACAALPRNRFGLISFFDADHGDGRADSLAWVTELLAREGVCDADGEIWLQCYPRVLGYAFKPVSFWYCQRRDASLAAVLVEVNNTFDERHCYLLAGPDVDWGQAMTALKAFHVSPFCTVSGTYRFRFLCPGLQGLGAAPTRVLARIDHHDSLGVLLQTSLSGALQPLSRRSMLAAFFGMPLMTFGVVARIHWQALKLFTQRVPWFHKPAPPRQFVSR